MEARTIIKLSKEISREKEKEETLTNLVLQLEERHFTEGGLAVSDSQLRERLVTDLETFRGQVKGARGVRRALEGGGSQGRSSTTVVLGGSLGGSRSRSSKQHNT